MLLLWWAMAALYIYYVHPVPQQYPSFILRSSNILGAFFIRAETVNSNFQRRARPSRRSKAAPTAHCPLTPAPITAPTRTLDMAGTGASPSASDISNALANGQDIAEPFQKRRRKSSGNGADVGDDAHDRSGRDQAETEDQGTLGTRGRDGVHLKAWDHTVFTGGCGCPTCVNVCVRVLSQIRFPGGAAREHFCPTYLRTRYTCTTTPVSACLNELE